MTTLLLTYVTLQSQLSNLSDCLSHLLNPLLLLLTQSSAFAVPPTFHAFLLAIFHLALGARTKLWGTP